MKRPFGFPKMSLLASAAVAVTGLGLAVTSAHAATITWGAAQDITGPSDISTNGTFVDARMSYTGLSTLTFGDTIFTRSQTTNYINNGSNFSIANGTFPTAGPSTANYSSLISTTDYELNAGQTITLGTVSHPLTVGTEYQVQFWAARDDGQNNVTQLSDGASNSSAITLNSDIAGPNTGDFGQFSIGTFTADATTEAFTWKGSSSVGSNNGSYAISTALALRQVVPEPATLGLMALAGAGILLIGRKRKSA